MCLSIILFTYLTTIFLLCEADINYYCKDLIPQPHVDIDHLMGMWYGVELITHKGDNDYGKSIDADCPILLISKDENYTNNIDRNYEYSYGSDYQYNSQQTTYSYDREGNRKYGNYNNNNNNNRGGHRYGNEDTNRIRSGKMKHLKILLSDNGRFVNYYVTYNESRAGFWMSSGPHNGSSLERRFDHLAGTIQVLKAVGTHMVLVFCYRMPEKRLYTLLVSREQNLSQIEIHGVHNLLMRRELSTINAKKLCANIGTNLNGFNLVILISLLSFVYTLI